MKRSKKNKGKFWLAIEWEKEFQIDLEDSLNIIELILNMGLLKFTYEFMLGVLKLRIFDSLATVQFMYRQIIINQQSNWVPIER